jgi:hypothetical protein
MKLSPDQLDDILARADVTIEDAGHGKTDLDPRLSLLHEINEELAKDGGQAGTHAYDMMAAVEEINTGNTAVLIELIAAVVMSGLISDKASAIAVSFSPVDIDEMQKQFVVDAKRDGMQLTVTLTRRSLPTKSWLADADESGAGAKPQAEAVDTPERPVWAVRTADGVLVGMESREDAETQFSQANPPYDTTARIENRFCLHETCPSTRCNLSEATSEA